MGASNNSQKSNYTHQLVFPRLFSLLDVGLSKETLTGSSIPQLQNVASIQPKVSASVQIDMQMKISTFDFDFLNIYHIND